MTTFAAFATALPRTQTTVRTLADARRGQRVRLGHIAPGCPLGEQLMELGLTPGTHVDVLERNAFAGHLRLSLRGATLPLRMDQAKDVEAVLIF
jgi:Fe2+ transport system protein FeoA